MRLILPLLFAATLLSTGGCAADGEETAAASSAATAASPDAGEAAYQASLAKLKSFKIAGTFTGTFLEQSADEGNPILATTTARLELSEEKVCSADGAACGPKYKLDVTYRVVKKVERAGGDVQDSTYEREVKSEGFVGFGHTLLLGNDRIIFAAVNGVAPAYAHFWIETNEHGRVRFEDPQRGELPSWAFGATPEFYPSDEIVLLRE